MDKKEKWSKTIHITKFVTVIFLNLLYITAGYKIKQEGIFYILIWTNPNTYPFTKFKMGQKYFNDLKCPHANCYLTDKTAYFDDIRKFDAILFNSIELHDLDQLPLPPKRAQYQKYVFVSPESPVNYPVSSRYNDYFNWTWTYKLASDNLFTYIVVKNKNGTVIGPKKDMHWMSIKDMKKPKKHIMNILRKKTTAVAWFVSHCVTSSRRENYIKILKHELSEYGHELDIYGRCPNFCNQRCPIEDMDYCYSLIKKHYYFYLAFENSMSEDYVTEKVLTATNNFAVPIVYGGANYSRFMPDGMYLDALELQPDELAAKINEIIKYNETYYNMFKWHNHYRFQDPLDSPETNGICGLCSLLNDQVKTKEVKVYDNIVKWFNERLNWNA